MSIKAVATSRRNYDWIALAMIIIGQLPTILPSFLSAENLGRAVSILGLLQLILKWVRTQMGLVGSDLEPNPPPPDDQNEQGVK